MYYVLQYLNMLYFSVVVGRWTGMFSRWSPKSQGDQLVSELTDMKRTGNITDSDSEITESVSSRASVSENIHDVEATGITMLIF